MSYAATYPPMNLPSFRIPPIKIPNFRMPRPRTVIVFTVLTTLYLGINLAHPAEFPPLETTATSAASQDNLNWDITPALLL